MNSPAYDIADLLEDSAARTGLTVGTDLFVGQLPPEPDTCVAVTDSGGFEPDNGLVNFYHRPTIQVFSRSADYDTAYANLESIRDYLHRLTNTTVVGSAKYIAVFVLGEPFNLGEDENNNFRFTLNFSIWRTSL